MHSQPACDWRAAAVSKYGECVYITRLCMRDFWVLIDSFTMHYIFIILWYCVFHYQLVSNCNGSNLVVSWIPGSLYYISSVLASRIYNLYVNMWSQNYVNLFTKIARPEEDSFGTVKVMEKEYKQLLKKWNGHQFLIMRIEHFLGKQKSLFGREESYEFASTRHRHRHVDITKLL